MSNMEMSTVVLITLSVLTPLIVQVHTQLNPLGDHNLSRDLLDQLEGQLAALENG